MAAVGIVRGTIDDHATRHPRPDEVGLIVEVSDHSLAFDRTVKAWFYASAGVPLSWIVNLIDRQVEVLTGPACAGYTTVATYQPGDVVPLALDGVAVGTVAINALLPRR